LGFVSMRRRLFNLAAAVSLMLCAAVGMLWALSYFRHDNFVHAAPQHIENITSKNGRLFLQFYWSATAIPETPSYARWSWGLFSPGVEYPEARSWHGWRLLGFDLHGTVFTGSNGQVVRDFAVPYWFLCLVTLVAPLQWFRLRCKAQTRELTGHCRTCGYDLR